MAQTYNWENPQKEGPWGGKGGKEFDYKPNGPIKEIVIWHVEFVNSLVFKSVKQKNTLENSQRIGGSGGLEETVVSIDWPKEYLKSISGTMKTQDGVYVVESIVFGTNLKKYGPFGTTTGTPFSFSKKDAIIVGFFGRNISTYLIDAIGVYYKSEKDFFSYINARYINAQVDDSLMMNMDEPRELGPWGGETGKPWDDGVFSAVKQIDVHVTNEIVQAIQVQYQSSNGKLVKSTRHGVEDGGTTYRVKLDGSEYLVGIMGFYGRIESNAGYEAVRSLSFYTNKGKYGPFGKEIGKFFSSPAPNGKVVGFHGRSGFCLDALGVHVEYP